MQIFRYKTLFFGLFILAMPLLTWAQSKKDTTDRLSFSLSPLSFAGMNPSLQGGIFYSLSDKTAIDAEGSYLFASKSRDGNGYDNIGFIVKMGYLISIGSPNNYWVVRMYCKNSHSVGRQFYSRFDGKYIERIEYHTTNTLYGVTAGWMRYTQHETCDFQIGFSGGIGNRVITGDVPEDAIAVDANIWRWLSQEPTALGSSIRPIFYLDFKILF